MKVPESLQLRARRRRSSLRRPGPPGDRVRRRRGGAQRELTFADVAADTAPLGEPPRRAASSRGDRLLVLVGKTPRWHSVMLAGLKLGAVTIPCSEMLRAQRPRVPARALRRPGRRRRSSRPRSEVGWISTPTVIFTDERLDDEPTLGRDRRHRRDGARLHPLHVGHDEGPEGRRAHARLHVREAHAGRALARRRSTTTSSGAPPARAGRSRSGTSCSGRGRAAPRSSCTRARSTPTERFGLIEDLGVTVLCQAPTEYRLMAKLDGHRPLRPVGAAPRGVGRRAAQPRGDQGLPRHVRPDHPRRLRADREHAARRQRPGRARSGPARWACRRPATTSA